MPAGRIDTSRVDLMVKGSLDGSADGAVRHIEISSDSRESEPRRSEVQAMLSAALDRAKREGLSLVTGELEVTEVTRQN